MVQSLRTVRQPLQEPAEEQAFCTRVYVVPDDSMGSLLPKGSLVLLHPVAGSDLRVGDLARCTDKSGQVSMLGQVCHRYRGRGNDEHHLTIAQANAEHTLWANRPYRFWYCLEIVSLADQVIAI